jgi:uncharacterized protein (TIGR03382 family)
MTSLLLLITAFTAQAYEVQKTDDGSRLVWFDMPIAYSFSSNSTPDGIDNPMAAVHGAFDTWASVRGSKVKFDFRGDEAKAKTKADTINVVYFEPDWKWDENTLAFATTWSDPSGAIIAFDMRINASPGVIWTEGTGDGYDLQSTLTHEVGHVLGFDHTNEVDATMFGVHPQNDVSRRSLHDDDQLAAQFLYPPSDGEDGPPNLLAALGCSSTGAPAGASLAWFALALAFARRRTGETHAC